LLAPDGTIVVFGIWSENTSIEKERWPQILAEEILINREWRRLAKMLTPSKKDGEVAKVD
jgi:hypothetical protein